MDQQNMGTIKGLNPYQMVLEKLGVPSLINNAKNFGKQAMAGTLEQPKATTSLFGIDQNVAANVMDEYAKKNFEQPTNIAEQVVRMTGIPNPLAMGALAMGGVKMAGKGIAKGLAKEGEEAVARGIVKDGGYSGYSKSNRAISAENEGRYPLTQAKKIIKQKLSDSEFKNLNDNDIDSLLKLYGTDEWHHTSKMYNKTPYYDTNKIIDDLFHTDKPIEYSPYQSVINEKTGINKPYDSNKNMLNEYYNSLQNKANTINKKYSHQPELSEINSDNDFIDYLNSLSIPPSTEIGIRKAYDRFKGLK